MGERLSGRGRENTLFIKVHGRLDLHAREARRIRARVNLREGALEVLLDFAPAGSFVGSGKDAAFGITC
jgi:hypothetical protein